jgi:hypothetical protein
MKPVTASTVKAAQQKLEQAVAQLLKESTNYPANPAPYQTRDLLGAAREYGRALDRVSRVRVKR